MLSRTQRECPHCGKKLYSAKEHLPKAPTEMQLAIYKFCDKPQTSKAIADHMGISLSATYRHLRVLQRLDQIEKIQDPEAKGYNHGVTFVATGKPIRFSTEWMRPTVMGVRL